MKTADCISALSCEYTRVRGARSQAALHEYKLAQTGQRTGLQVVEKLLQQVAPWTVLGGVFSSKYAVLSRLWARLSGPQPSRPPMVPQPSVVGSGFAYAAAMPGRQAPIDPEVFAALSVANEIIKSAAQECEVVIQALESRAAGAFSDSTLSSDNAVETLRKHAAAISLCVSDKDFGDRTAQQAYAKLLHALGTAIAVVRVRARHPARQEIPGTNGSVGPTSAANLGPMDRTIADELLSDFGDVSPWVVDLKVIDTQLQGYKTTATTHVMRSGYRYTDIQHFPTSREDKRITIARGTQAEPIAVRIVLDVWRDHHPAGYHHLCKHLPGLAGDPMTVSDGMAKHLILKAR